jgi:hypothetical protein
VKKTIFGYLSVILSLMIPVGCGGNPTSGTEMPTTPTVPVSESSQLTPAFLAANGYASPGLPRITAQELKQQLDRKEAVTIVDVRARVGFKLFSIQGAINIPNDPEEESIAGLRSLPKDRLIVFYCT